MRIEDIMKDDDLYDAVFGEDSEKKSKKKKKKKDKDKSKSYKARLKEMSKQELRDRIVSLGINAADIDTDSKKDMRRAILKSSGYSVKEPVSIKAHKATAAEILESEPATEMLPSAKVVSVTQERPPHFFDEDGSFVIPDALNAPDMTCYEAMESLGAARRTVRPTDGFGEMMDRLTRKLVSEASKPALDEGVIDVEFKDVTEEKTKK